MTNRHRRKQRRDIAQEITDRIIARIEEGGELPWRRPWMSNALAFPLRHNGERYRGINVLLLALTASDKGYTSPYWMTFNQAIKLDARVRKGERSTTIVYYGTAEKRDDDTETEGDVESSQYRFLRGYPVFNSDQIDGLPESFYPALTGIDTGTRPIEPLDRFVRSIGIPIRTGFERAAYREIPDEVVMPDVHRFKTAEAWVATCLHELAHASGIAPRLARECFRDYHRSKVSRAQEEIIVEIAAAQLCALLGIPPGERRLENHAAYVKSWLACLNGDKRWIFRTAADAQRAVDWIWEHADHRTIDETAKAA